MLRLKPIIEGNASGPTLFFVHGWPDDATLWSEQIMLLSPDYRCVRVELPNYGRTERVRWGYETEAIVEALADCIHEASPNQPVTLIAHDWGAYWGYMVHHRHPERIERMVGLDVAPHYEPNIVAILGLIAYQSWLWAAFAFGGSIGDGMTRWMAESAKAPKPESATSLMNYPYRNAWYDLFSGRTKRATKGYWPTVPQLYVYGEQKLFHFHSQNWLDHVERLPGGKVVGLPCNHWVTRAPEFNELLKRWLAESGKIPE